MNTETLHNPSWAALLGACLVAGLMPLLGVGCAENTAELAPEASSIESVVAAHITRTLDAMVSNDAAKLAALPEPESSRLQERRRIMLEHDPEYRRLDYGARVGILSEAATGTAAAVIAVSQEIAWLTSDGHSYGQENHLLTIEHGQVVKDEYIEWPHSEADKLRGLPVSQWVDIKALPSSPWDPVTLDDTDDRETKSRLGHGDSELASSSLRNYALTYCGATSYNPSFPNYNAMGGGGDCTNFVSQCLTAGGLQYIDDLSSPYRRTWATYWWSNIYDRSDHSYSWALVNGLRRHFAERSGTGTVHWIWEQAHVGDVVFFDRNNDNTWDHACVMTTAQPRSGGGFDLKISCHSNSRCDESLYEYAGNHGWWIQIVHMP